MRSFVNNIFTLISYQKKKAGFWLVWIFLCPIVFLRYLYSDIINGRFAHATCYVKTSLVFHSVYQQMVKPVR